jgi:hypothetical protein
MYALILVLMMTIGIVMSTIIIGSPPLTLTRPTSVEVYAFQA